MAKIGGLNKQNPLYQEDLMRILTVPGIENLKGKSFLITGASRLIGVCLIDALMAYNNQGADITIYAIGRSKEKAKSRLGEYYDHNHFFFIEQDVREPLPDIDDIDFIIPLASNTHPLAYSQYPIETIAINYKGAEHSLNKATECKAVVLYPSSVEVYGNARGNDFFTEDYTGQLNLTTPRACYTESKRVCEALCQSFISEEGTQVKIVRLSRVFGPTMQSDDSKASSQFIINALKGEDIVLKSKGEQFFSYTYVADAVRAMLFVLLSGKNGIAYNISSEMCNVHLKDFAQICADMADTHVVFDYPTQHEAKGYSVACQAVMSNDRLRELGFKPFYSFVDAVKRTLLILGANDRNDS